MFIIYFVCFLFIHSWIYLSSERLKWLF